MEFLLPLNVFHRMQLDEPWAYALPLMETTRLKYLTFALMLSDGRLWSDLPTFSAMKLGMPSQLQ